MKGLAVGSNDIEDDAWRTATKKTKRIIWRSTGSTANANGNTFESCRGPRCPRWKHVIGCIQIIGIIIYEI